jgi:hypothetical protein
MRINIVIFAIFVTIFVGCDKEEVFETTKETEQLSGSNPAVLSASDSTVLLGQKLANPYSLVNMQKAYDSLVENGGLKSSDAGKKLKPTHWYLRFLPKTREDLELLWGDKKLELFDYPLDYELIGEGKYRDPSIPEGQPGWMYAAVPVDYKLPPVDYEILEEIIIPKHGEDKLKSSDENDYLLQVEQESLILNGYFDDSEGFKSIGSYNPWGFVKVQNTSAGWEGLRGIKVRARYWFHVETDYTDINGFYYIGNSFSASEIDYDIIFENYKGFTVWEGYISFAPSCYYIGLNPSSNFDYYCNDYKDIWLLASINNGVYHYITQSCPANGISTPPSGLRLWALRDNSVGWGGSAPMLHYLSLNSSNVMEFLLSLTLQGAAYTAFAMLVLPDVFIAPEFTTTYSTYSTLFHELSHASHYSKVGKPYWPCYINGMVENWLAGDDMYGDGTGTWDGYIGVGEMWGNYFGNYVCCKHYFGYPVYWESGEDWYNPGFLMYSVSLTGDLTISEIYSCLSGSINDIDKLKSELKTKTYYDSKIDEAYSYFPDWP